jgi:Cation/multidrug efflux pump
MKINIIDYVISHSRVFMGILIFIIFSGASTYISIPKESTPDVSIPIVLHLTSSEWYICTRLRKTLSETNRR